MDDAEPAPIPGDRPRIPPRHRPVWVRTGGTWRAGHLMDWYRADGRWAAWVQLDHAGGTPWPEVAGYFYDPETIRLREADRPPPE